MSKIATYLNEHLMGEVVNNGQDLQAASTDRSQLLQEPEMIAHVASTSDIRKIARFCWQLAEKGHSLSLTARGHGSDITGAAVGTGIVISPIKYMHRVMGIDPRLRLVHMQAGAPYDGANMTLSTHKGMMLPSTSFTGTSGSLGGAIASGSAGYFSARYGTVGQSVQQLEVVLANGDVLQTERLAKNKVNAKKGLHTMEGEVYRKIDNLITDNHELIQSLAKGPRHDTAGYRGIVDVKRKDGSIDLTPLFVGSQGSLGIITEAIMRSQFQHPDAAVVIAAYSDFSDAQAAADVAMTAKAAAVELIDGRLLRRAALQGKKRDFAPEEAYTGGIVIAIFDAFAESGRLRPAKKLEKDLVKTGNAVKISLKHCHVTDLADVHSILEVAAQPSQPNNIVPGAFSGLWLPTVQLDSFLGELRKIEAEHALPLPIFADISSGFLDILPVLDMKKVSDRQKLIKALTAISQIVSKQGGSMSGRGGDGRLKAVTSQASFDDEVTELYRQIKEIFDPHNILNPGVKQPISAKDLASQINAWCRAKN